MTLNNKTKTAATIVATIIIGMALLSPTVILPSISATPQPKPFYLPNPALTNSEKQQLINIAMNQPGVKAWSDQWQFSTIDFKGEKTGTGVNWQDAIVFLRLPASSSIPFQCEQGWIAEVEIDMISYKVVNSVYPTVQSHECHGFSLTSPGSKGPAYAIASDNDVETGTFYGDSGVMTTPSYNSSIFGAMDQGISFLLNTEWTQTCTGPDPNCFLQAGWLMTTPSHSVGGLPANSADVVFVDESVTGTLDAYNTNIAYSGGGTLAIGINCLAGGSTVTISMQYGTATFNDNSHVNCTSTNPLDSNQYDNSVFFENQNTKPAGGSTGWAQYITGITEATNAQEDTLTSIAGSWLSSSNTDVWQSVINGICTDESAGSTVIQIGTTLQGGGTAQWTSLNSILPYC
jgi:hypothetical protein